MKLKVNPSLVKIKEQAMIKKKHCYCRVKASILGANLCDITRKMLCFYSHAEHIIYHGVNIFSIKVAFDL